MEKRIGSMLIMLSDRNVTAKLNDIISSHADIIIGRQGIPLRDKGISIISLVYEGTLNEINALSGQIGKLDNVQVKALVLKEQKPLSE